MIIELEEKWLSQIVDFLRQSFENKHIPSHDHTHHQRVWENAKDIMTALEHDAGQTLTPNVVECVFWATLFHDVGLTQNLDEHTHGNTSAQIFQEYVTRNNVKFQGSIDVITDAICFHDAKDYKNALYQQKNPDDPVAIVCASDDLDAYGAIGVFRYAEIYIMRGIPQEELGARVLINLQHRFENFTKLYRHLYELFTTQQAQYILTHDFYQALINQDKPALSIVKFFKDEVRTIESVADLPMRMKQAGIFKDVFSIEYIAQLERDLSDPYASLFEPLYLIYIV